MRDHQRKVLRRAWRETERAEVAAAERKQPAYAGKAESGKTRAPRSKGAAFGSGTHFFLLQKKDTALLGSRSAIHEGAVNAHIMWASPAMGGLLRGPPTNRAPAQPAVRAVSSAASAGGRWR